MKDMVGLFGILEQIVRLLKSVLSSELLAGTLRLDQLCWPCGQAWLLTQSSVLTWGYRHVSPRAKLCPGAIPF